MHADRVGEVKTVLPRDEALTPGIIYVLIAGLTGSVISRTRAFPIRFLTPPLFTVLSMPYFLPKTSHNIRQYLSQVEDRHFPEFAARHDQIMATSESHFEMLKDRVGGAGKDMSNWSKSAVEGIERNTGLKVGDVVRRGQEAAGKVRNEIETKLPSEGAKLERVGYVVEQKPVAELVRPVVAEAPRADAPAPAAAPSAPVPAAPPVNAPAAVAEQKKPERRLV
jgi:organizing structure protein 2